jgi:Asp-tRNA(Asn)/Glu-tRNA(Gln) amidotransferase A subunit family amidase
VRGREGPPPAPQDTRVDRRSFLARMGALTAAAAAGTPASLFAAPVGDLPGRETRAGEGGFWDGVAAEARHPVTELENLAAWEAGALLRRGEVSSRELVQACLDRIARWDGLYRAFNTLVGEDALRQADELDRRRSAGGDAGLLHGVPLAIKDNFYTRGVPTTANSHIFRDFVPAWTAPAVTRLQEEGGIMVGKTQMGPLATTRALTPDGEVTTLNAWAPGDPSVNPGGSSTGSATAVAARLALSSIGTQTGGSITVPAMAQGLTGLKPTMGRVSLRGVIPLTYSRDHVGPLARDAADAAILLQAMAGPDAADPRTQGLPGVPDYLAAARAGETLRWPTRLGVLPGWTDAEGVRGEQRRAFLSEMEAAGAELVEIDPSERWEELSSGLFNAVRLPERSEPFLEHLRNDVRLFGVTLNSWMQGLFLSGDELLKGQRARYALLSLTLEEIFEGCDVVVQNGHVPFDMIGLPLITFPVGFRESEEGRRPEGILLGAPPFGEERLLSVAAAWQARTGHHRQQPLPPASGTGALERGRLDAEQVAERTE